ncbi:MAG: LPS assembly protein LptD [Rickettsiales bacterium]|nr:LPS assembly protein LptD [Rickettsiales bacterium]
MYSYAYDRGQSKHIKNNSGVDEETERKYKNSRNFFNFKSGAILGNEIHLKTDINYALDPYLLRDYFYDYRETLQSNLNVFKIYDYSHINFDLLAFQQIGERNNAGVSETPLFVPLVEYDYSSRNLVEHGNFRLNLHSRILDSYSAYNKKYAKVNFDTAAVYSNLFSGLYANASLAMYSDIYYKLDVYTEENRKYRFYPELEIKLLYPVFLFEKIEVIPILQYFTSEKRNLNLTNLDSKNSELTMNNLFSRNRYGGYDLVETGDRVNYGLKVNLPTGIGQFSLNIGQGYRNFIDNKHRIDFFSKEFSYLLTMFGYRYSNLSLNYMNHIDNTAHRIDRGDLIVSFNHSRFSFNISHVYVSNRISTTGNDEERLSLNLMFAVTKKFYSSLEIGGDLVHKNLTGVKVAFGYEDNCYRTELIIDKQDFMDPSSRNSVPSFRFRFGVKN